MGINFQGVLNFVDLVGSLHMQKALVQVPCARVKPCMQSQSSYMPQKYKPSKSSYLFKPRKFNPSNLNTLTVDHASQINVGQKGKENQWRVADLQEFLYTALLYQAMTNRYINAATSLEQYSVLVEKEQRGEFLHGWLL